MLIRANAYKSFMLIRAFFLAPFFSLSKSLWDIRALPYGYKSLLCRSLVDFWNSCTPIPSLKTMFCLFLRPEDTSPSTSCLTPHMKHNHATLQTLHQQEPCRQEQHSPFKTKLISPTVSNHLYKCPDAYKSQTLIRAFSLVPHIGSYKHTCTVPMSYSLGQLD